MGKKKLATAFTEIELPRQEKKAKVERLACPNIARALRQRSEHIRWYERERMRLQGLATQPDFDKRYAAFEKEQDERAARMRGVFAKAGAERRRLQSVQCPPDGMSAPPPPPPPLPANEFSMSEVPTRLVQYEVWPYCVRVSGPIVAQPDAERWKVDLRDDEASISLQYRFWLPPRGGLFTGLFEVRHRAAVSGRVEIKSGGHVRVWAETAVGLRRCEHSNRNHDGGFHYDPACDSDIRSCRSQCQPPYHSEFVDTTYGLHEFGPRVDVCAAANDTVPAGTGHFIDLFQYVVVTAANARVMFESGNYGTVHTPRPALGLRCIDLSPGRG